MIRFYKAILSLLNKVGLDVFRYKPGYNYVPDFYGKSAFKHMDIRQLPIFGDLAKQIIAEGKTSHYYDRLYTIYQAIINISQLQNDGAAICAEVGVYKGGTSKFIALLARAISMPLRLYGLDTFEGHARVDIVNIDGEHTANLFGDTSLESVSEYLNHFPEITLIKGRFQDNSDTLKDLAFHFVHLDVDLYEPTLYALWFFADRMVQNGMIVVDDYGFSTCLGIEKAVSEFLLERKDFLHFHVLSGQMILVKQ